MDPQENFIRLRKAGNNIGVDLLNLDYISKFTSFEVSLIFYPLDKAIKIGNISFLPFDEYVADSSKTRSIYKSIADGADTLFGIILGILTIVVLLIINPNDLSNIRSVVSAVSAYALGKEIWKFIDNFLVDLTERWRISFRESSYAFKLRKPTTITRYTYLAKQIRFGVESVLPSEIDLIRQSNSELIKLFFTRNNFSDLKSSQAQILIIDIDNETDWSNYLIAVKITFNKSFAFFTSNLEYFEAVNKGELGCLDANDKWNKDCVLLKKNFSMGRLKYLSNVELKTNSNFIEKK